MTNRSTQLLMTDARRSGLGGTGLPINRLRIQVCCWKSERASRGITKLHVIDRFCTI
jgi:hypothetical protein